MPLTFDAATPGEVVVRTHEHISREDLVAYAHASGDQNPIHQDEAFAKSVGLPDVIAHGMFTMGLVGSVIEELAGGSEQVLDYGTRFASPVVVNAEEGASLSIEIAILKKDDESRTAVLDATVSVEGIKVLSRTRATIRLS